MITFNAILEKNGLIPKDVQLVRHQDTRNTAKITLHKLWLTHPEKFERYQSVQASKVFRLGKYIACFVVTPRGETLFVGLYRVNSLGTVQDAAFCPVNNTDDLGKHFYELEHQEALSKFAERLVIDWGKGRKWVQYADKNEKPILELRPNRQEERFPGFREFTCDLTELGKIPESWKDHLAKTHGVYLLMCKKTGRRYVGSSKGADGLWQRLHSYEQTKHGGNVELKKIDTSHMQVTILERVDTGLVEKIEHIENLWKTKLLANRKFPLGLNGN